MMDTETVKVAATTFNYSKMVTPEQFDEWVAEIQAEAWAEGIEAEAEAQFLDAGYGDIQHPQNPYRKSKEA